MLRELTVKILPSLAVAVVLLEEVLLWLLESAAALAAIEGATRTLSLAKTAGFAVLGALAILVWLRIIRKLRSCHF